MMMIKSRTIRQEKGENDANRLKMTTKAKKTLTAVWPNQSGLRRGACSALWRRLERAPRVSSQPNKKLRRDAHLLVGDWSQLDQLFAHFVPPTHFYVRQNVSIQSFEGLSAALGNIRRHGGSRCKRYFERLSNFRLSRRWYRALLAVVD